MVSKRFELLRELLVNETFKRSVFSRLEKHRDLSQAAGSDSELLLADSAVANEHMDDVIRKHILEKVGWPPLITANEVRQQIVFQVAGTSEQDLDKCMLRLQAFLCQDVVLPTVSENDIDLGLWGWPEERLGEATIREELWLTNEDDDLRLILTLQRGGVDGHPLSGHLWGYATQSALEHTVDQLRTVVPSIAVTVAMLSGYQPPSYTTPDGGLELYWSEEKQASMVKLAPERTAYAEEAAAELMRHIEIGVAPPFTALVSNESRRLFDACLRACFLGTGSSKSSMSSRVNNAVLLLAEADSQRTAAISLSLSFAAIEALVCTRTEGTTEELARKTAALLQPTAMDRPEAICAIRQLYKHRCNALHGTSLDNDWVQGSVIRKLAAAVLKAVIEWISHCDRLGEKPTAEAFHRELNNAEMTGSRMVGVPDQLRECLPSS